MASEYTANYRLDLYVNSDKPNLRDQYNAAMNKVDAALVEKDASLSTINSNITTLGNNVTTLNGRVDEYSSQVGQNTEDIQDLQEQVTDNTNDIADQNVLIQGNQASIQAINTRCSDIESDVSSLETTVGDANSGLVKRVTDLENVTEDPDILLIFGDSWSDFNAGFQNWWSFSSLETTLKCDMRNFAVSGSGFTGGTSRINAQVNTAANALSTDEQNRVRWIIVTGGVNDIPESGLNTTYSIWKSAIVNFANNCHATFTNAQIIFAPTVAGVNYNGTQTRARRCVEMYVTLKIDLAKETPYLRFTPNAPYPFVGTLSSQCYNSDSLHLNTTGAMIYAKDISDAILGSVSMPRKCHVHFGAELVITYDSQGTIIAHGSYTMNGSVTLQSSRSPLTELVAVYQASYSLPGFVGVSGSAQYTCWIRIQDINTIAGMSTQNLTYYF